MLEEHATCCPFCLARARAGKSIAARIAIIAITTSNSIRVKPIRDELVVNFIAFALRTQVNADWMHRGMVFARLNSSTLTRPVNGIRPYLWYYDLKAS